MDTIYIVISRGASNEELFTLLFITFIIDKPYRFQIVVYNLLSKHSGLLSFSS